MIVTNIVNGKKGQKLVFIDGVFAFFADEETVLKNSLSVGCNINFDLAEKIKSEYNKNKSKQKALNLLSFRSYSKKELINKIKNKYDEKSANDAANKMEELGIVDDEKYAVECANKLFRKFYSVKRVRFELSKKGIDSDIVSKVIEDISPNEREQISRLIDKRYSKKMISEEGTKKVFLSLKNLGYSSENIRAALLKYKENHGEDKNL